MTPHEAAAIVAAIAAAYPMWPASRETVAVYADALADLPAADVRSAVAEIIRTEDRWPSIATIRRITASRAGLLAPSGAQAWAEVRALASSGAQPAAASHPAISEAISAIGWWDLRTSSNPETIRAQFLRIYEDCQRRADRPILAGSRAEALGDGSRDEISARGAAPPDQPEAAGARPADRGGVPRHRNARR